MSCQFHTKFNIQKIYKKGGARMVNSNITTISSYFANNATKSAKTGKSSGTETFTSVMQKNAVSKSENNSTKDTVDTASEYNSQKKAESADTQDSLKTYDSNEKMENVINKLKDKMKRDSNSVEDEASNIVSFYYETNIQENADIDEDKVIEALAGFIGIDTDKLENYLNELGFSAEDLLNTDNAMKLAMMSKGVAEAAELLVNHELSEEIKNFAEEIKTAVVSNVEEKVQVEIVTEDEVQENIVMADYNEESSKDDTSYDVAQPDSIELQIQGEVITDKLNQMNSGNPGNQNNKNTFDADNSKENDIMSNLNVSSDSNVGNVVDDITNAIADSTKDLEQARIISQIIDGIRVNAKPEITSMEIQLYPEHLGKVTVEITSNHGILNAKIAAETESAKRAIEGQLTLLKDNLNNQGIKVETVEVTIAGHGFEENLENGNQKNNQSQHKNHRIRKALLDEINGEKSFDEITEEAQMETIGNTVSYKA